MAPNDHTTLSTEVRGASEIILQPLYIVDKLNRALGLLRPRRGWPPEIPSKLPTVIFKSIQQCIRYVCFDDKCYSRHYLVGTPPWCIAS